MQSVPSSLASLLCLASVSCSSMQKINQHSTAFAQKTKASADQAALAISNLLPGQSIPVVKVREDDLLTLPSGHERALAYQKNKRSSWIWGGPVDFSPPALPTNASSPDGSLLPPIPTTSP